MTLSDTAHWADVDAAVEQEAELAFSFLERLIAAPSTVGAERGAQDIVAAELAGLGFEVSELPVPDPTTSAAPGGVAQAAYAGRPNVLGRVNPGGSPSLLLNGHVDVVPAEADLWSSDPFGVLGDAVIVLEPTGLDLLPGGVGVLWAEIEIAGVPAHAEAADREQNPIGSVPAILRALAAFEDEINGAADDPAFGGIARPYNVNVGTVTAGDWASSGPGRARLRVRVGFPRGWSPDEALKRVSAAVLAAGSDGPWLAGHPLNQFGVPALAYGPRARNIHAIDEAVELASIVTVAKALARFIAGFYRRGATA